MDIGAGVVAVGFFSQNGRFHIEAPDAGPVLETNPSGNSDRTSVPPGAASQQMATIACVGL
jgi:hypothetical protein